MRDAAVAQGVTINGLVINNPNEMPWIPWHTHPPGGLDNYYRENVAGGPGAFVMQAENFESFSTAIIDKLVREIARSGDSRTAGTQTASAAAQGRTPETKYLIGNVFTAASRPRM